MLVEDDASFGEIICHFLEQKGWRCDWVKDGSSAFERAIYVKPDIILTDLNLPGLMGMELSRRLKAHPQLKFVPIIMMTGQYQQVSHKVEGLTLGADDYLIKPFDLEILQAKLLQLLIPKPRPER